MNEDNNIPPAAAGVVAPSAARRRLRKFRVPVLILALFAVLTGTREINVLVTNVWILALVVGLATAAGAVAFYIWLSRTVELRPDVPELAAAGRSRGLVRGAAVGAAAFFAVMAVIGIFGGVSALSWGSFAGFLASFGAFASVAVNEELLFRGVVFRILEERCGTWIALAVSSLIFGLVHLVNGGATLEGTLSIALEGGMLMASAYVATRSLWAAIGLHFAWDFAESGIFSVADSGTSSNGLLHTVLSGPTMLTGGAFGPEASLVALVVCAVPTVLFLRSAAKRGLIRPRPWAVKSAAPAAR